MRFTVHSAMSDADCSRFLAVMDEARALWSGWFCNAALTKERRETKKK